MSATISFAMENEDALVADLRERVADPLRRRIDMDTIKDPNPDLHPPISPASVRAAEASLRVQLPSLLRRIYCEVGNGGFGPGAGLLGIGSSGYVVSHAGDLVQMHTTFARDVPEMPEYYWPRGLLPLFDWGCAMWTCVDARSADARVVMHDDRWATTTRFTLYEWWRAWLDGVQLFEELYEFETQVRVTRSTASGSTCDELVRRAVRRSSSDGYSVSQTRTPRLDGAGGGSSHSTSMTMLCMRGRIRGAGTGSLPGA